MEQGVYPPVAVGAESEKDDQYLAYQSGSDSYVDDNMHHLQMHHLVLIQVVR